jgi:hypothetical protein
MQHAVIGFSMGALLVSAIYAWGGVVGERAERNLRIRRAAFRSRQSQWSKL